MTKGSVLGASSTWGRRRVRISLTNLSVGQEKELIHTLGFAVCSTYKEAGGWINVGGGTVEGSEIVDGGLCLGKD